VYRQILINAKLNTGKRGHETEVAGRSALKRVGRSALDSSAIWEVKQETVLAQ